MVQATLLSYSGHHVRWQSADHGLEDGVSFWAAKLALNPSRGPVTSLRPWASILQRAKVGTRRVEHVWGWGEGMNWIVTM